MKKKYRNITVNDIEYAWMVGNETLTIWKDKEVIKKVDVSHCVVTPGMVADYINEKPKPASIENVLVLSPMDLTLEARNKKTKDVQFTDIAISKTPFTRASIVLYVNQYEMKILKSRYKIVE